jgi:hypothetical protein
MSGRSDRSVPSGPYETEQHARADVAGVYEQSRRSMRQGVLAEGNHAYLAGACQRAGVVLGAFDARILAWLANYEPETCAVVAGLITRAYAAGRAASGAGLHGRARKDGRRQYR